MRNRIQKDIKKQISRTYAHCRCNKTTIFIKIACTHRHAQKGQHSQIVSTALSVAIITRQLYIMKTFSIAAPICDICIMGGVKLNIRFTIICLILEEVIMPHPILSFRCQTIQKEYYTGHSNSQKHQENSHIILLSFYQLILVQRTMLTLPTKVPKYRLALYYYLYP